MHIVYDEIICIRTFQNINT